MTQRSVPVSNLARHIRGLIVALVILLFSAGIVFGARSLPTVSGAPVSAQNESDNGDENAAEETDEPDASESTEPSEAAEPSETPESAAEAETPESAAEADTAGGDHGAIVSEAAQMPTPDGFKNHGAWVSCVAHMTKVPVAADAPALTLADITPDACAAAQDAKEKARADAKAAREAARAAAKAARLQDKKQHH
jgi:hypothetical protein